MNTINTVGDLKKALSVYQDDQHFQFYVSFNGGSVLVSLNNDTQIYQNDTGSESYLSIILRGK